MAQLKWVDFASEDEQLAHCNYNLTSPLTYLQNINLCCENMQMGCVCLCDHYRSIIYRIVEQTNNER